MGTIPTVKWRIEQRGSMWAIVKEVRGRSGQICVEYFTRDEAAENLPAIRRAYS